MPDRPALATGSHPPAAARALAVWEQLWTEVTMLAERYRINPGKDWWEHGTQVEALAALAAWVARYDSGEWDDPPGKLAVLYDLERVRELISAPEPFYSNRDRAAFARFLMDSSCQPPPSGKDPQGQRGRKQE